MKKIRFLTIALLIPVFTFACYRAQSYPEYIKNGIALYNQGKVEEARAEFTKAVRACETSALSHYLLGLTLADEGNFPKAMSEIAKAVELRPDWQWARLWLAMLAIYTDDFATAEAQLTKVLDQTPDKPDADFLLGLTYSTSFQYDKAISLIEKRLTRDLGNQLLSIELGLLYNYQGKFEDAIRVLSAAALKHPDSQQIYFYLARAYANNGQYQKAEETYLATPSKNENPRVWLELAEVYVATGEREKLFGIFDHVEKDYPDRIDIHDNLGNIFIEMKEPQKAREAYEKIRASCPKCPSWAYGFGRICEIEGKRVCAVENYRKAIELSPDHKEAKEALSRLHEPIQTQPNKGGTNP